MCVPGRPQWHHLPVTTIKSCPISWHEVLLLRWRSRLQDVPAVSLSRTRRTCICRVGGMQRKFLTIIGRTRKVMARSFPTANKKSCLRTLWPTDRKIQHGSRLGLRMRWNIFLPIEEVYPVTFYWSLTLFHLCPQLSSVTNPRRKTNTQTNIHIRASKGALAMLSIVNWEDIYTLYLNINCFSCSCWIIFF